MREEDLAPEAEAAYMEGRFGNPRNGGPTGELPKEGTEPVQEPPPKPQPITKPGMSPTENPQPKLTARQFASRLPVEHRGGFLAFVSMEQYTVRKTVIEWQTVLKAHWARKIR
jgi:hypothetical protein